ncbi:MAG: hypothetical protein AAGB18_06250 [Pseudomonadota bacterium]
MQIAVTLIRALRKMLFGSQLEDAAQRHKEATDRLDAALREVLKK